VLQYAWKIGNVAVRELADHAPINYVWGIIGMIPYFHPHVYGQKLVAPLASIERYIELQSRQASSVRQSDHAGSADRSRVSHRFL
jgi:hypothetical protein